MGPSLEEFERAAALVHAVMPPTPQYRWPLLEARAGTEVWVKHENHLPVGAFKVRGGIVYMAALRQRTPEVTGVIAATRGNHGQSIALAATRAGLHPVIIVPRGNSPEKNAAMAALGAELIEHGSDFQAAFEHAERLAGERNLHFVRSFDPTLILGVGSAALELFRAVERIDAVYVPVGMGSGLCAAIAVRDALGLDTEVIGVVAAGAPAYALSFAAGKVVATNRADTIADGMACRVPVASAVEQICAGAARIVTVEDAEIRAAMRHYFTDTHNIAEGAGAAPLAALLQERDRMQGRRVALILTGGNVDRDLFAEVLAESD